MQLVTCRNIYGYVNIQELVYTHIFPCSITNAWMQQYSSSNTEKMGAQILQLSNSFLQWNKPRWRNGSFRSGVGNMQDKPGVSCSAYSQKMLKQNKNNNHHQKPLKKKDQTCSDGIMLRRQVSKKRAPNGQSWNNLNNKIKHWIILQSMK